MQALLRMLSLGPRTFSSILEAACQPCVGTACGSCLLCHFSRGRASKAAVLYQEVTLSNPSTSAHGLLRLAGTSGDPSAQPLAQSSVNHSRPLRAAFCWYLQGWRYHNLSGQPLPVRYAPHSKKLSSCI